MLDAATGTVLSSETLASFKNGEYLSWNLSGNVVIKVTNLDPKHQRGRQRDLLRRQATSPPTATLLRGHGHDDRQGSWRGTYGANGYDIAADTSGTTQVCPPTPRSASPAPRPTPGPQSTTDTRSGERRRTPAGPLRAGTVRPR